MFKVFNALPVAREFIRTGAFPERVNGYHFDTITLGWEERLKARGRRRSDRGLEFGTALARGTVLLEGDCLLVDDARTVVSVVEREDAVFVIRPATLADWAIFTYAIGNSHQPVMITSSTIVCPDVLGMRQVLEYHDIPFRPSTLAFTPLSLGADPYSPGHQHNPDARTGSAAQRRAASGQV